MKAPGPSVDSASQSPPADASRERGRIAARAAIVAAGTLTSRVLGLFRDQVIAAVFSRATTDAFFVAFALPNVLRQLLGEGAVQSAVLPVLAATKEREGDDAARRFFANVRGVSLLALGVATLVGVLAAPALVDLFAVGFRALPGQYERTVLITRWVFPYLFFMGTAALGVAALNTYQRFTAAAFAPALLNVAFIGFSFGAPAWLLANGYEPGLALAFAVLVGGVLQMIAQWPSLHEIGYLGLPRFEFGEAGVREVFRRMGPVLVGMGVYYVDVLLARRFLSQLGLGAQSYFSWALRLCDFPQGIFVMALQTAALPSLSRLAARGDRGELAKTAAFGLRLALFVAIPASLLYVALAEPLVVLLFQRGAFDRASAHETARALVAQGAGIWLVASVRQLVSVYYSLGDTRTPVLVAGLDLGAFVLAALLLRGPLGHAGVSAAVTLSSLVQAGLLWWLLQKRLPELPRLEVLLTLARTSAAAGIAALAALGLAHLLRSRGHGPTIEALLSAPLFGTVFLLSAALLRSPELAAITPRRLRRPRRDA
jgi:putative peptidoglycan lipid II flippase